MPPKTDPTDPESSFDANYDRKWSEKPKPKKFKDIGPPPPIKRMPGILEATLSRTPNPGFKVTEGKDLFTDLSDKRKDQLKAAHSSEAEQERSRYFKEKIDAAEKRRIQIQYQTGYKNIYESTIDRREGVTRTDEGIKPFDRNPPGWRRPPDDDSEKGKGLHDVKYSATLGTRPAYNRFRGGGRVVGGGIFPPDLVNAFHALQAEGKGGSVGGG